MFQKQGNCQKGEIPAATPTPMKNTSEGDVAPDRVPGPGALSGGRISSRLAEGGLTDRRTDRQTGKISLVSPWALHASRENSPRSLSVQLIVY